MLKIACIIIVVLFLLLLLLSIMKLSVTIFFQHAQDDDECRITIKTLFGLIRYTIHVPVIKVDKQSPSIIITHKETVKNLSESPSKRSKYTLKDIIDTFEKTKNFARHVVRLNEIVKKFFARVSITKFEWQSKIGTGDAAYTGMAAGLGWSLKYSIVALFSKYMKLKTMPVLMITPCFQQTVSETKFVCMIHFRVGHTILAGIRIVKYWRGNHLSEIKSFATQQANESY
ncbi:DUF2953 domain-containing protein [Thermaerobacillus caldiproteolyticus]|uniref:DUF2953 domain-containing protein n=1 Tax=Thermaerobacillus caldiproteolyticus TaxID=247480 RepID=UPI00188BD3B0|nr:DUF2953 domain-containing protein [Anoxybacillus caldiproteolyticus]QPA30373.1 DUF2953 domain-containing protein [Anoxybacillus caldiproteolyticus]